MILGKVSAALSLKRLNILRPNPCQMKVQGNIFKLYIGHFYVKSLLHGVICVTMCQRPSNCFFLFFFLSSPGHFSVNDLFTVSKQLAIRFQRNFTCILMGSVRIAVQNYIDLAVDLDLSRSQICKSTFWAISRFLLDKLSPNFNTG